MKKNIVFGVVGTGVVVALLFGFKALINQSDDRESVTENQDGSSLELGIERIYPKTPSEVIEKFAQINKYAYSGDVSEEEIEEIVENLRLLYDQELLELNSEEIQRSSLLAELYQADLVNRKMMNYEVDGEEKVEFKENKYGELATLNATFYFKEEKGYPYSQYTFVLRKDKDGKWKILGWDYAEKEGENQEDTISE